MSSPTLYRNGRLWPAEQRGVRWPEATALVVAGGRILFVGSDAAGTRLASGATEVDLGGRLVTPAFVDAHVHTVQTGQTINGLDLSEATSRTDVLDLLRRYVARNPSREVVVGYGWDERSWPDPQPPLPEELDRAGAGAVVYLARVDVHSAVVSTSLLDRVPGIGTAVGFRSGNPVTRDAHHRCRRAADAMFADTERRRDALTALSRAAETGIATVHELGGPHLGPESDLASVRDAARELGMDVVCYWGELADTTALQRAQELGVRGLAGDLCVDGSIGSRTAALHECYRDYDGTGTRYLDVRQVADHVVACTRAGLQAGFHCIGDAAVSDTVAGFRDAAARLGASQLRAAHHRLEHLEMIASQDIPDLAALGVTASMQPAFDATWGGPGELYQQRLGERSRRMNRLATLERAGVPLAFGSDSPVTPLAGWGSVRAAALHWQPEERLGVASAFRAASVGGARAGRDLDLGRLAVGWRASIAIWDSTDFQPDTDLCTADRPAPRCAATLAGGRVVFSDGSVPGLAGAVAPSMPEPVSPTR